MQETNVFVHSDCIVIALVAVFTLHTSHKQAAVHVWPCLTHWGRVMHICVSKLAFIGSDNGLSPGPLSKLMLEYSWFDP